MDSNMKPGAEILVHTCAGIQKHEQILIVTDEQHLTIATAIKDVANQAGAETVIIISPVRVIDNQEPAITIAQALKKADVIFLPVTHALAHTLAVREAINYGARVISMTAFTERMICSGGLFADFFAIKPTCDSLARRLTDAKNIRVTNPAGTEITTNTTKRSGNSHCCIVRSPGFTAVPNIEANIAPVEGSTEGLLVADGSIPYYGIGILQEPVKFEIKKGFVTKISGSEQAGYLCDLLAAQNDRYVYNLAQFSIGLNPECTDFTGEMLNDEGVRGTIHIGIGTSANLGGTTQAKTHFDVIIRKPSVWLDDQCVINRGEIIL